MALSNKAFKIPLRAIGRHHSPLSRLITAIPTLEHAHPLPPFPAPPHHAFHTSRTLSSALFNLGGLSTSRENQFLSKEKGRPRTEFSPHLELIRSSEVDTQRRPSAGEMDSVAGDRESTSLRTEKPNKVVANVVVAMSKTTHGNLLAEIATLKEKVKGTERDLNRRDWVISALICCSTVLGFYYAGYIKGSSFVGGNEQGTQQQPEQEKQQAGEEPGRWILPQDLEHTGQLQVNSASRSWRRTLSKLFWAGAR